MKTIRTFVVASLVTLSVPCGAQLSAHATNSGATSIRHLELVKTTKVASELADSFLDFLQCDSEGNVYLVTDTDPVSGIRKLNSNGDRTAVFRASSDTDLKLMLATRFTIASDGDLYQLVVPTEGVTRYAAVFDKDGTYKSSVKFQVKFPWHPDRLAAFASGALLVSGLEEQPKGAASWPFTAIFSSDGRMLKEVSLEDDSHLHEMAASGDSRVTSTLRPGTNSAVSRGALASAADGNIYLMRWLSPAVIYAISPGGEVVRRFEVDPGNAGYMPSAMRIAGNRVAVQFFDDKAHKAMIEVVDLEGHEVARYDDPLTNDKGPALGLVFACYTQNPERFTFLTTLDDGHVGLLTVEPR